MMDWKKIFLVFAICSAGVFSLYAEVVNYEYTDSDLRRITRLAVRLIGYNHYRKQAFDSELSRRVFDDLFDFLDPDKVYFTRKDVAGFAHKRDVLYRDLLRGNFQFGFDVYSLYRTRFSEFHDYAVKMLSGRNINYNTADEWIVDRKKVFRPADETEQKNVWRKKVTRDALILRLAEKRLAQENKKEEKNVRSEAEVNAFKWEMNEPEEKLIARLRDVSNSIKKKRPIDILGVYLDVFAGTFGSHSGYMAPALSEDFDINMRLSLSGIGATLSSDDGFIRIVKVVKGGPAGLSGKIHREDRIICAVQNDGSCTNLLDVPVSQAVRHIRGERGTDVLLGILSGVERNGGIPVDGLGKILKVLSMASGCSDYSCLVPDWRGKIVFRGVLLKRDNVKLDDFGAKGSVREVRDSSGKIRKVGVIDLPSFYMDFAAVRRGDADARRGSADVKKILEDFKRQKVDSVVVDLRSNGGGSLPDAVVLAGLFIKSGTVVQVRSSDGEVEVLEDPDEQIHYDGPLVVLISKFSASASEIFAGAMRDHKRAILVGDSRTFGKGTVLTVEDLSSHMRLIGKSVPAGSATFEIAMFFRATGSSVQQLGISSDIVLPSLSQEMKAGEMFLDNHLPWSEIPATEVGSYDKSIQQNVKTLSGLSQKRISANRDYIKHKRLISTYCRYRDRETISLNEAKRYKEYLAEAEVEKEAERLAAQDDEEKKHKTADVVLDEAAHIAADYALITSGTDGKVQ